MNRRRVCMAVCVTLLALNVTFIWVNSALPAPVSAAFSEWTKGILMQLLHQSPSGGHGGTGVLRKLAHFLEFASLGLWLGWLFRMVGGRTARMIASPLLIGAAVACVDETIQFLNPGRGPSMIDVGIDTVGVFAGIVIISLIYGILKANRSKKQEDYKT